METVLKTRSITKKYGQKTAVNNVSMTINKGDIYGFIGRNGAGKTTFMRIILSLSQKDSGDVVFFDNQGISRAGMKIGSLIEEPGLYKNTTAYENLKRFAILFGVDSSKINEMLKLVGLENVGKKKVKDFSLGMIQRLGLAIALLGEPEFVILDEPVNGLDPYGMQEIREIILKLNKEKNITFLISSHYLDELSKIVTKYGLIDNGVLVEEIEASKLKEKCKDKIVVDVCDIEKAKEVISKIINSDDIEVKDNLIEIHSHSNEMAKINKYLSDNKIEVNSIYQSFTTLEEYFMKKIGGSKS